MFSRYHIAIEQSHSHHLSTFSNILRCFIEMSKTTMKKLATIPAGEGHGPPSVIHVGLWRMGTASMATAYNMLGLRPHHALDMYDTPEQWALFEKAADATWPSDDTTEAFTREQWDEIYGGYDAIVEIGGAFAEQLIKVYPDAKVVIVRRDFEKWYSSFCEGILDPVFSFQGTFLLWCVLPVLGNRAVAAMRKILSGFFGADSGPGIKANARNAYDEYFERITELVPPENRLEYRLGSGWGPLCAFLGRDAPAAEFPFVNEANALREVQQEQMKDVQDKARQKIWSLFQWR
jgi:hypothetical protein